MRAAVCTRFGIPFIDNYDDLLVAEHRVLVEMIAAERGVTQPSQRPTRHQPQHETIGGRPVRYEPM